MARLTAGPENPTADRFDRAGGAIRLYEIVFALVVFACLVASAFGGQILNAMLPPASLHDEAQAMVRLIANFLIVAASLTIGLMLNSAKTSLDTNNRNVHAFATELIVLDRTMAALGPEADDARRKLVDYVRIAVSDPYVLDADPHAESVLESAGASLRGIHLTDSQKIAIWNDARATYRQAFRLRWVVVDATGQTLPTSMLALLVAWLAVIFVSFGYRAPRDRLVTVSQILAAALIAGMIWLILDMDTPTSGFVRVSSEPLQRALVEIDR